MSLNVGINEPVGNYSRPEKMAQPVRHSIKSSLTEAVNSIAKVHQHLQAAKKNLHERTIAKLDSYDLFLDQKIPNFPIQNKIDRLGQKIKEKFAPLTKFNKWLDSNGHGSWYRQLAIFLVKLPLRVVRNILKLLYDIVKTAIYAAVHPLKALNHLAKQMVNLIYELTKPETLTKIGAGVMGASLGQLAVTGNPFSAIGLGVGAALAIGGLSLGALQAALEAEEGQRSEAALHNLWSQVKGMPEAALTGFCLGLLIGAISKVAPGIETVAKEPSNPFLIPSHDGIMFELDMVPSYP